MLQLVSCRRCNGFLAFALSACPHCDAPVNRVRSALLGLATLAGGGAVSMTLMACYGGACLDDADCSPLLDASADALERDVVAPDVSVVDPDAGDAGEEADAASDAAFDGDTDGG